MMMLFVFMSGQECLFKKYPEVFGQDRNLRDYFTFLISPCFNPSHLTQGDLCASGGEFLANNFPVSYGYVFLVLISGERIGGKRYAPVHSNDI